MRFWGEPPLVREPDTLIFGLERVDPAEQELLSHSPLRHVYAADIQLKGASVAAQQALSQLHSEARDFVLHVDLDAIAQEEFAPTNVPGSGGLTFSDVQASLNEFLKQKNLIGLDVAQYNPDKDPDGTGAKRLVELLSQAFAARFAELVPAAPAPADSSGADQAPGGEEPPTSPAS